MPGGELFSENLLKNKKDSLSQTMSLFEVGAGW